MEECKRVECTLRVTNMNTVKISGVKLSRYGTTSSNEILFTHRVSVFFFRLVSRFNTSQL